MEKQIIIHSKEELTKWENVIKKNSELTVEKLKVLQSEKDSAGVMFDMKFTDCGLEPLFGYDLNIIEQLNQMYTYIVSLKAVGILLVMHPGSEFIVNFGTRKGYDIMTGDGEIICECFASTDPMSNRKIVKDLDRLEENEVANYKYEFFYSLKVNKTTLENLRVKHPKINIIRLGDINL